MVSATQQKCDKRVERQLHFPCEMSFLFVPLFSFFCSNFDHLILRNKDCRSLIIHPLFLSPSLHSVSSCFVVINNAIESEPAIKQSLRVTHFTMRRECDRHRNHSMGSTLSLPLLLVLTHSYLAEREERTWGTKERKRETLTHIFRSTMPVSLEAADILSPSYTSHSLRHLSVSVSLVY